PEGPDGMPTLVADISATQDISASVREVLRKVDSFISDNSDSFHSSIKNVEAFTKSLKDNSEKIDRIVATVDRSLVGVENLTGNGKNAGEISETLKSFKSVADDV